MSELEQLLEASAARHSHLCPRQVLGVRMGLAGARLLAEAGLLEMQAPRHDKALLVILETDGCFADGVEAATGCSVGHRTLRVEDYGKAAATFVPLSPALWRGQAVRLAPRPDVRQRAWEYAPQQEQRYFAQLHGYQHMPDEILFSAQWVELKTPVAALVSRPGQRVDCALCGEEVINERQVFHLGMTLCRACAGEAYYHTQPAWAASSPVLPAHLPDPCSLLTNP